MRLEHAVDPNLARILVRLSADEPRPVDWVSFGDVQTLTSSGYIAYRPGRRVPRRPRMARLTPAGEKLRTQLLNHARELLEASP